MQHLQKIFGRTFIEILNIYCNPFIDSNFVFLMKFPSIPRTVIQKWCFWCTLSITSNSVQQAGKVLNTAVQYFRELLVIIHCFCFCFWHPATWHWCNGFGGLPTVVDYRHLVEARANCKHSALFEWTVLLSKWFQAMLVLGKKVFVLFSIAVWHCRCHSSIRTEINARRCRLKVGSPCLLSI